MEIEEQVAVRFMHDQIGKEQMLEDCYPQQMSCYRNAIEQTRQQLLNQITIA